MHKCSGVNDIIRQYKDAYCQKYKVSYPQARVIGALSKCRTARLGGHLYKCDNCGKTHIVYNSCRNRHCPTCQNLKTAKWLLQRTTEILPIQYFHVVFTVPDLLNPLFRQNKAVMYNLLFNSAAGCLTGLSRDPKHLGAHQIGFISVLHTWSQTLLEHPHIHGIVTGGGLSKDQTKWISCKQDYFINVRVLSMRFRMLFLKGLKALYGTNKLILRGKIKKLNFKPVFRKLLDKLYAKAWVVHCEGNYSNPKHVFDYIGRYIQKVAIGNHRIIKLENGSVYFRYTDYADNGKSEIMSLSVFEFIRRFLLHVVPRRFVKVRYYGLLSHRDRKKKMELCRKALGVDCEIKQELPDSLQALYEILTGEKIDKCPYCRKGSLVHIKEIPRACLPRGPD
jgi:hypothetical protein